MEGGGRGRGVGVLVVADICVPHNMYPEEEMFWTLRKKKKQTVKV